MSVPHGETDEQRTSVYSSLRVIGFCYMTAADVMEHDIEEDPVTWLLCGQSFVCCDGELKLYATLNWQPVQFSENCCNAICPG